MIVLAVIGEFTDRPCVHCSEAVPHREIRIYTPNPARGLRAGEPRLVRAHLYWPEPHFGPGRSRCGAIKDSWYVDADDPRVG